MASPSNGDGDGGGAGGAIDVEVSASTDTAAEGGFGSGDGDSDGSGAVAASAISGSPAGRLSSSKFGGEMKVGSGVAMLSTRELRGDDPFLSWREFLVSISRRSRVSGVSGTNVGGDT